MTDTQLIERVVREVLRQLHAMSDSSNNLSPGESDSESGGKQLSVQQRVVTLNTLNGHLSDVNVVVVRQDAIVTPSVRDELRDRGIDLRRNRAPIEG